MTEFIILSRGDILTLCKDEPVKVWIDKRPMLLCSDEYFEKQKSAVDMPIQALQEPTGDYISRQAVLNFLDKESHKWGNDCRDWEEAITEIKDLPSAENTGRWKKIQSGDEDFPENIVCSRCGHENSYLDFGIDDKPIGKSFIKSKYCPHCGSRMVEEGERA